MLVSFDAINIRSHFIHSLPVIYFVLAVSLLVGWLTYVSISLMNTPRFALKYYLRKKAFTRYISL